MVTYIWKWAATAATADRRSRANSTRRHASAAARRRRRRPGRTGCCCFAAAGAGATAASSSRLAAFAAMWEARSQARTQGGASRRPPPGEGGGDGEAEGEGKPASASAPLRRLVRVRECRVGEVSGRGVGRENAEPVGMLGVRHRVVSRVSPAMQRKEDRARGRRARPCCGRAASSRRACSLHAGSAAASSRRACSLVYAAKCPVISRAISRATSRRRASTGPP